MPLTEVEARRLLAILEEFSKDLHVLSRRCLHADQSNIWTALQLVPEIKKWEMGELDRYRSAADQLLQAWQRAEALSGKKDMDLAEAVPQRKALGRCHLGLPCSLIPTCERGTRMRSCCNASLHNVV